MKHIPNFLYTGYTTSWVIFVLHIKQWLIFFYKHYCIYIEVFVVIIRPCFSSCPELFLLISNGCIFIVLSYLSCSHSYFSSPDTFLRVTSPVFGLGGFSSSLTTVIAAHAVFGKIFEI